MSVDAAGHGARRLHRALEAAGADPSRTRYVELLGAVHLMCAEDWETTMGETLRWLATHNR